MLEIEKMGLVKMSQKEKQEVEGGINPWVVIGICALISFGVGCCNGYKEAERNDPRNKVAI